MLTQIFKTTAIVLLFITAVHAQQKPIVILETNQGNIKLMLYDDIAPKACENFIGLVKKVYYDGIIFHRVIKNFMIQGGDPTGTGTGGESVWGGTFEDEFSPDVTFNRKGLLAMANQGPNTNGSQFFITVSEDLKSLNNKYTIFGEVLEGYETVEKIEKTSTGMNDRPLEEQQILRAY